MVINGIIDLAGAFVCPYDAAAARLAGMRRNGTLKINCSIAPVETLITVIVIKLLK